MMSESRPYMTRTFELADDIAVRITVERGGDPVEVAFGATTLMLTRGLAITIGRALVDAAKGSIHGERRQAAREGSES